MDSGQKRKNVLFLCTGNSARSQMAEGYLRKLGGNSFSVKSAGIAPVGLNPLAVRVMAEEGIDISSQSSDTLKPEHLAGLDLIITLCGDARENCPYIPINIEKRHWPLSDPARAAGNDNEKLAVFRTVRNEIKKYIDELVAEG